MRYIDIAKIGIKLSKEQKQALLDAEKKVKDVFEETESVISSSAEDDELKKANEKRTAIIEKYSHLWSEIKDIYAAYSHGKCWYSESINSGSKKDMDHFRPKGKVYEDNKHPGYWWLAFNWENYRFSCQFCNQLKKNRVTKFTGGKGTHFPLINGSFIAYVPTDNHKNENPVLLDPCVCADPKLLYFDIQGMPMVHPKFEKDTTAKARVDTSIKYLNIDQPEFVQDRALLYNEIKDLIEEADREYNLFKSDEDKFQFLLPTFRKKISDIERKRDFDQEYSRAADAYIRQFRGKYEWVEQYFEN